MNLWTRIRRTNVLVAGLLAWGLISLTGQTLAPIHFHVQDPQARPLVQAAIHADSPNGAWNGTTDAQGDFTANLAPGHYDLTFSAPGYKNRALPADLRDPGTITVGLDATAMQFNVRGRDFVDIAGNRIILNGTDMFLAYRQYLDGQDLTPFFQESHELGFTMWRVFFQGSRAQNGVLQLSPQEPRYYERVRPFAQLLNSQGITLLAVIGVDNQDISSPVSHWGQMADLLRDTGTLLSFGNEWSKNGFNPGAIPAPQGILWSRGSDVGDQAPFKPQGLFLEFHPVRNYTTAMRDAVASAIELYEVQGYQGPLIIDEPGRMGTNAHDGRFTDPKEVQAYARILTSLSAGVVMHNYFGQRGLLMDALTRECAKAWTRGTKLN